ncbi:hypothetical protein [Sphaerothrix gracilis]|uniref:hypothetical protein n=1 Tax=Sphaerothrix gracilis TaxID=3151835 RepID=UPI0031FC2F9A
MTKPIEQIVLEDERQSYIDVYNILTGTKRRFLAKLHVTSSLKEQIDLESELSEKETQIGETVQKLKDIEERLLKIKGLSQEVVSEVKVSEVKVASQEVVSEIKVSEVKEASQEVVSEDKVSEVKEASQEVVSEDKVSEVKVASQEVVSEDKVSEVKVASQEVVSEVKVSEVKEASQEVVSEDKVSEVKEVSQGVVSGVRVLNNKRSRSSEISKLEEEIRQLNENLEKQESEKKEIREKITNTNQKSTEDNDNSGEENKGEAFTSSDSEFNKLISGFTREKYRNERAKSENADSYLQNIVNLFISGGIIDRTLIYVAVFFPGLTPNEFNQVVSILLKDKAITIEKEEEILNKEGEIVTFEGKLVTIKREEEQSLLEIWQDSHDGSDKYLKQCHLRTVQIRDSSVIDFVRPNLRNEVKAYLKEDQALYLDNVFKKTQLFLFHPQIQVARSAINLLLDAMSSYPSVYNEDWIFQLVNQFSEKEDWTIGPSLSLEQIVKKFLKALESESRRRIVLTRISGLLYFTLNDEKLSGISNEFLQNLFESRRYDDVIDIIEKLENFEKFDDLCLIKQLLDNDAEDEKVRDRAYDLLYKKFESIELQSSELLSCLQSWLPDQDAKSFEYSHSSKIAVYILIDYSANTLPYFPQEEFGSSPSSYHLLTSFTDDGYGSKFEILVSILFHKDSDGLLLMEFLLGDIDAAVRFLGSLIAEWFLILTGFDTDIPEENIFAIDDMLRHIVVFSDNSLKRMLNQFWDELRESYLHEINYLSKANRKDLRDNRRILTRRRNSLRRLKKKFKLACKSN